jgi:hypothetical protein
MPTSPYIDGNRATKNRAVKFDPVNNNADIPYVALEDKFTSSDRLHTFAPVREVQNSAVPASGIATIEIDTRGFDFCFIRLESGAAAFTECIVDISTLHGSGKWETIANGDYFYTTGTGEAEGNAMKLIRKVKSNGTANQSNPRILAASQSTWLILFTAGLPQVRFRISTTTNVGFLYTLSQG